MHGICAGTKGQGRNPHRRDVQLEGRLVLLHGGHRRLHPVALSELRSHGKDLLRMIQGHGIMLLQDATQHSQWKAGPDRCRRSGTLH